MAHPPDMRIALFAAAAAILVATAPAQAADLAPTAAALRDKALADPTAWAVAESLTTEIGARPQGSPAMDRARDWGVEKLKSLGFVNVHVETFETTSWLRGAESAEIVSPYPQKLQILGLGRSTPTPPGGIEAEVVLFKSLAELMAQPPGSLKGKIAVVTQAMRRTQGIEGYGSGVLPRVIGGSEAARRGAVAFLVRSVSTDDTRLPHTGGAGATSGIPMAALSTPDADLLERMTARGKPVRIKLSMDSTFRAKAPAYNVVGEIPGREAPDEVVIVGGHLDSWDPGTGAVDDAAGIAITTAAARLAGAERPRRTIRVVMWGAEEQGGSGGAYAAAHKDEVGKIIVAGESDLGAGEIYNAKLPKGSLGHPAMQAFAAAVTPLKAIVSRHPAAEGGSDTDGLRALGVPVTEFNQDAGRYFDLHHSADDTLDKIDPRELAQNVAVWAAFIYTVADSDIDFRKTAAEAK